MTYFYKCSRRKEIKITINSKINLKNSIWNIIAFLYFSIYGVDECGFWMAHISLNFSEPIKFIWLEKSLKIWLKNKQ